MDVKEKLVELLNKSFAEQYEKRGLLTAPHTATDLIANGVTVQEWISVKDRLPEKYGRYLALTPSRLKGKEYDEWLIYYLPQSGFYDTDPEWGDIEMDDVTHWMPLPQPPKGE